jgi:hypothetical protein
MSPLPGSRWINRVSHGVPIARALLIAEVAMMAQAHLVKLDARQRRRMFELLLRARGRPSSLSPAERLEFMSLFARLEPRLFMGMAAGRLSPVPLPKRVLYGRRGGHARAAERMQRKK